MMKVTQVLGVLAAFVLPLTFQAYMLSVGYANRTAEIPNYALVLSFYAGYACLALVSKRYAFNAMWYFPAIFVASWFSIVAQVTQVYHGL